MSTATPTDGTSLAVAIAVFETEFPGVVWTVSKSGGGLAMDGFSVVASSIGRNPAHGVRLMTADLVAARRRRSVENAHQALLTAEYGPEVVSCK